MPKVESFLRELWLQGHDRVPVQIKGDTIQSQGYWVWVAESLNIISFTLLKGWLKICGYSYFMEIWKFKDNFDCECPFYLLFAADSIVDALK